MRCDALVIGAGPAGSTTANLLAAAGWSVAIVEKSEFPRRKVCGEFVSGAVAGLLRTLGAEAEFRASAGPEVRRVALFALDSTIVAPMPAAAHMGAGGFGRALGRERLDALLLEHAARRGARVWQPFRACDLRRSGDEYVCTLESKGASRHVRAPIVIAAHGSWERGGLPTQRSDAGRASEWLAFKAHFREADLAPDLMPLLAFPGGYGGLVHSDSGRLSLSCCIRRSVLERVRRGGVGSSLESVRGGTGSPLESVRRGAGSPPARAGQAVLEHIVRHCAPARACLGGAGLDAAWLGAGPIAPGIRLAPRPGIFAVGNAAGEAHPVIAEGISMAMQAAALLAAMLVEQQDAIASPRSRAEIEARYASAWRARFATRIRAANVFAQLASSSSAAAALLPLARAFPAALTLGARLSGKAERAPLSACEAPRRMRA